MTKWYLYKNEEVIGPYPTDDLERRISKDTRVCRAGEKEWNRAVEVPELQSVLKQGESKNSAETKRSSRKDQSQKIVSQNQTKTTEGSEEDDIDSIEPTLENLVEICEKADGGDLIREYESFWTEYDDMERKIILEEIDERGLSDEI